MKLEDQLGCFGYFGFGAGFDWAKGGLTRPPTDEVPNYCLSRCRRWVRCSQAHRERVRSFVPAVTEFTDAIARTAPGPKYLEVLARAQGRPLSKVVEPYRDVMTANAVDGMAIALGRAPAHRGPMSLAWPLVPISRD